MLFCSVVRLKPVADLATSLMPTSVAATAEHTGSPSFNLGGTDIAAPYPVFPRTSALATLDTISGGRCCELADTATLILLVAEACAFRYVVFTCNTK